MGEWVDRSGDRACPVHSIRLRDLLRWPRAHDEPHADLHIHIHVRTQATTILSFQ